MGISRMEALLARPRVGIYCAAILDYNKASI